MKNLVRLGNPRFAKRDQRFRERREEEKSCVSSKSGGCGKRGIETRMRVSRGKRQPLFAFFPSEQGWVSPPPSLNPSLGPKSPSFPLPFPSPHPPSFSMPIRKLACTSLQGRLLRSLTWLEIILAEHCDTFTPSQSFDMD